MIHTTCKTLRAAVSLAAILFLTGMLLQLPALLVFLFQPGALTAYLSYLGLISMLASPVLILFVGLVSLLPGVNAQLGACQH